jgi:hypothetical protein
MDHAEHWSCFWHGLHRFRACDNGVQQINGALEFNQCLHRADVPSRDSMALIGYGKQGAAVGGIGFLMIKNRRVSAGSSQTGTRARKLKNKEGYRSIKSPARVSEKRVDLAGLRCEIGARHGLTSIVACDLLKKPLKLADITIHSELELAIAVMVRPEGANHQWRRNPPGELSIDPVADERLMRVTAWIGAW